MVHVDWTFNANSLLLGLMALGGVIISARASRQRAHIERRQDQIHKAVNGNLTEKLAELPTIDQTKQIAQELAVTTAENMVQLLDATVQQATDPPPTPAP